MMRLVEAAVEPDSMVRAKELLDLIKSPTAIATGILLVFSKQQLKENAQGIRKWPTVWAMAAALAASLLTYVIVAVMTPLSLRVLFTNRGGIETRLLVYVLTYLVAIGTAVYATSVVVGIYGEFKHGKDHGFKSAS